MMRKHSDYIFEKIGYECKGIIIIEAKWADNQKIKIKKEMKEAQEGTKRREKEEIERSDRVRGLMLWINETKERYRESCEKPWVRGSERRRRD